MSSFPVTQAMLDDALRFMGVSGSEGEETLEALERKVSQAFSRIEGIARPLGVWKRFPLDVDGVRNLVRVADAFDVESRDLTRLFARSSECFLLAVTLGPEVDRQISLSQRVDMLEGMALDACASVWADAFCDEVEKEARATLSEGEHLTMRFSPGYGDVPLATSESILEVLDAARRIGLSVTRSQMMTPVKSITAMIGISDQKEEKKDRGRNCAQCALNGTCPYRKRGDSCGL
ncbi:MAG: methionine synthase [Fretibacterium sp.]|nr:methionine synthase [Fretibacterium sp.]